MADRISKQSHFLPPVYLVIRNGRGGHWCKSREAGAALAGAFGKDGGDLARGARDIRTRTWVYGRVSKMYMHRSSVNRLLSNPRRGTVPKPASMHREGGQTLVKFHANRNGGSKD